jgi:transposase
LESLRPDVEEKRKKFLRFVRRIPVGRLVFLDESGMNLSMTRSHAWVKRGQEYVDRVPINWGKKSLTVAGAIRLSGWVVQSTSFESMNKDRFVRWLKRRLLPRLQPGDILVMDNLSAHKDRRVIEVCAARGVRVIYLPPYSPDLNPIEPGWALQKKHVRRCAPREPEQLRRVARRARYRVKPHHAAAWFKHSGYSVQPR